MLILQGVPPLGGVNQRWGWGKTSYFEAKCVNISKTVGYTSNYWLIGSCICAFEWHQDRWRWMTLNCISSNFQRISQISEVTTAKRMKKGQYCQRQRRKQLNVFSTLCSLRSFTVDYFARRPSYTHCCRALTLAFLARISCTKCTETCK